MGRRLNLTEKRDQHGAVSRDLCPRSVGFAVIFSTTLTASSDRLLVADSGQSVFAQIRNSAQWDRDHAITPSPTIVFKTI